jgi:site-specific DNA-methyltransferase (adenine-specific)
VYVNPPYGRVIGRWIVKAMTEPVDELILLVPARTDTAWFQPLYDHAICFIRGRLRFSGARENAPFPCALVYRGPRPDAFAQAFSHRGVIVERR